MENNRDQTVARLTRAFARWEEQYRADPEGFMDQATRLATDPTDLGELRACYLLELLDEIRADEEDDSDDADEPPAE